MNPEMLAAIFTAGVGAVVLAITLIAGGRGRMPAGNGGTGSMRAVLDDNRQVREDLWRRVDRNQERIDGLEAQNATCTERLEKLESLTEMLSARLDDYERRNEGHAE